MTLEKFRTNILPTMKRNWLPILACAWALWATITILDVKSDAEYLADEISALSDRIYDIASQLGNLKNHADNPYQ